jgi:hypothetical protein
MNRLIVLALLFVTICIAGTHLYNKGLYDGEWNYKRSHHMELALKSAYHFGYMDGHEGRTEDWDGEIEMKHHHHGEHLDKNALIEEKQYTCSDCTTPLTCPPDCK